MNVMIRFFNEDDRPNNIDYFISDYFPRAMKQGFIELVNQRIIFDDDYIIGPFYYDKNRPTPYDGQIGFTGGIMSQESDMDGCIREMGEEIGLVPINKRDLHIVEEENYRGKTSTIYACDITKTRPLSYSEHNRDLTRNLGKDQRHRKTGGFVVGKKTEIQNFFNKQYIYRYFSTDNIIGLIAIPVRVIKSKLNKNIRR